MKPTRPAWVTVLAIVVLLALTIYGAVAYGILGLVPLAFALAFYYDLSHHAKAWHAVVLTRAIAGIGLAAVIICGIYVIFFSAR